MTKGTKKPAARKIDTPPDSEEPGEEPHRAGRKGGGAKLGRSETVTVRLDPRLRYLAELVARKHRRTLSSFVEWALEQQINSAVLSQESTDAVRLLDEAESLWDPDEADRFAQLALMHPDLLTHQEQVLWKLIRQTPTLWLVRTSEKSNPKGSQVPLEHRESRDLHFRRLREHWDLFRHVAYGELLDSALDEVRRLPTLNENLEPIPEYLTGTAKRSK